VKNVAANKGMMKLKRSTIMYNLRKNNYHQNPKSSTIYTPKEVSEFIFQLLKDKFTQGSLIFDPCCGKGNLLEP